MCLFVYFFDGLWPFLNYFNLPPPASTCILTSSQFCVFSIPLQAHQEPERKATSLNCGWVTTCTCIYSTRLSRCRLTGVLTSGSQCSWLLSIPQETELKAAYISLTPNDEGLTLTKAVWRRSVPASYLWPKSIIPSMTGLDLSFKKIIEVKCIVIPCRRATTCCIHTTVRRRGHQCTTAEQEEHEVRRRSWLCSHTKRVTYKIRSFTDHYHKQ